MTTAMSTEAQQEILAELASIYQSKAERTTDKLDQASLIGFGQAIIKTILETDILSISPEGWTDEVKQSFIDTSGAHIREFLDEISASWPEKWRQILFTHFDNRGDYVKSVLEQIQLNLAQPKDLTIQ